MALETGGGWQTVADLWRARHAWVWPLLLTPLLACAWVLGHPGQYLGTVTLQLDQAHASSPLLQDWSRPASQEVLQHVLKRPDLLADTARDVGQPVTGARLALEVMSPQLLRISYAADTPRGLAPLVSTLAYNFIYELLAPERLRLEQQLAGLGSDLRQIDGQLAVDTGAEPLIAHEAAPLVRAVDIAQLRAQKAMLQQQYSQVLASLSTVNAAFDQGAPHALLWLAEPARVAAPAPDGLRLTLALLAGLAGGLALALVSLTVQQIRQARRALPENLPGATGETLAGQLPNLGTVNILPQHGEGETSSWQASVAAGTMVLDPTQFTEVIRLHRALTRGLHGALVVASSSEDEGKTLLAALLGLRSHAQGKRTLLVDLNLKDAGLSRLFEKRSADWGMGDETGSRGRKDDGLPGNIRNVVVPLAASGKESKEASDGGLHLLPAPTDPATLAFLQQGPQVLDWLDRLGRFYEHIIIDTTPVLAINRLNADPLGLAVAARTVLVVRTGVTPLARVRQTLHLLRQHGVMLTGLVANDRDNPDTRAVLLGLCRGIERIAPGLAQWLRAKMLRALAV